MNIRLEPEIVEAIKAIVARYDPDAVIYLFGSRADPAKKGGDIDLLVVSQRITPAMRRDIRAELLLALGERKMDLIVTENPGNSAFTQMAFTTGVKL
jgi:predicted nucleotidyltransferase